MDQRQDCRTLTSPRRTLGYLGLRPPALAFDCHCRTGIFDGVNFQPLTWTPKPYTKKLYTYTNLSLLNL